ncbi:MAG: 4-(cytidine 5'-diphospho)-2-C-methyl-D-erythritol kinase [Proteobacteria bacterium]|nr:4-(cytidine 5'-diphospho)-2-C-methyl-D-erythritol kinase [Pseudomonadota bacterium]
MFLEIQSPAKINLFLHISGKRPDGYHELLTLMCCVTLYDILSIDTGYKNISVSCTDPEIPSDEKNHAHRAAALFFKKLDKKEGVKIYIDKKIPTGAGLGGGSSNAAAVLSGLNNLFGNPFPLSEIMKMGLEIGADVPFFLFKKPALARGIGNKLEEYPMKIPYKILIIYPGFGVSTKDIYNNLNLRLTNCKNKLKNSPFERKFDPELLCNDLESVTASRHPEINEVKEALLKKGAEGALMSGSGSSVFGLFPDDDSAIRANNALSMNHKWRVFLADIIC